MCRSKIRLLCDLAQQNKEGGMSEVAEREKGEMSKKRNFSTATRTESFGSPQNTEQQTEQQTNKRAKTGPASETPVRNALSIPIAVEVIQLTKLAKRAMTTFATAVSQQIAVASSNILQLPCEVDISCQLFDAGSMSIVCVVKGDYSDLVKSEL